MIVTMIVCHGSGVFMLVVAGVAMIVSMAMFVRMPMVMFMRMPVVMFVMMVLVACFAMIVIAMSVPITAMPIGRLRTGFARDQTDHGTDGDQCQQCDAAQ
jgi:hypothetical protein